MINSWSRTNINLAIYPKHSAEFSLIIHGIMITPANRVFLWAFTSFTVSHCLTGTFTKRLYTYQYHLNIDSLRFSSIRVPQHFSLYIHFFFYHSFYVYTSILTLSFPPPASFVHDHNWLPTFRLIQQCGSYCRPLRTFL